MGKTTDTIVNKLTSGRFWCIILFAVTMCYLAKIEPSVRDAFFALAGAIVRDYFGRSDRAKEEPKPNGA